MITSICSPSISIGKKLILQIKMQVFGDSILVFKIGNDSDLRCVHVSRTEITVLFCLSKCENSLSFRNIVGGNKDASFLYNFLYMILNYHKVINLI